MEMANSKADACKVVYVAQLTGYSHLLPVKIVRPARLQFEVFSLRGYTKGEV